LYEEHQEGVVHGLFNVSVSSLIIEILTYFKTLLTHLQVAKSLYDCHVTAICSSKNIEYVKSLGADETIDYTSQPVLQTLINSKNNSTEYDLLIDCVGGTDLIPSYVRPPLQIPNTLLPLLPSALYPPIPNAPHSKLFSIPTAPTQPS
jgi:hypothetical protein